ncbi:MAG: efflux RND transporter periplasmic adaptor subunit [Bacteroidota bacterium]
MKHHISFLSISLLALILIACGSNEEFPDTLEGQRSKLQAKKQEMLTINDEIKKIEARITELDDSPASVKQIPVEAMTLKSTDFKHYLTVQGEVEANQNVVVSPQTAGQLVRLFVKEGQQVRKGQILAQLDDAVIKSNINEIQTRLEFARVLFQKQKNLWDQEIGTEVQYLQAKNNVESLEKSLLTAEEQLAYSKIKSPIAGTVDEIFPKTGEYLAPGVPTMRIVSTADLNFKANLSESYIPFVKRNDEVTISFNTIGKTFKARVSTVGQFIDPVNRTFTVEMRLPRHPMLKPNMIGEVAINDRNLADVVTVPLGVLQKGEKGSYVYVVESGADGQQVARRINVKTGLSYQGEIVIDEGLKAGQSLITTGYKDLSDGQLVKLDAPVAVSQ